MERFAAAPRRKRARYFAGAAMFLLWASPLWSAPPPEETTEAEPLYAAPTRIDRTGRVLAAVEVNGRGPFRFILDTGANRSALAPKTAEALGLTSQTMVPVELHGVTGSAMLPAVEVESLRAGNVEVGRNKLPVLPAEVFAGADGILGVEGLRDARVEVDFVNDRVSISRSNGKRAPSGYLIVPAQVKRGGLLIASARVGGVPVQAIIDTGAERSLGNAALRDALMHRVDREDVTGTTVIGATPDIGTGVSFRAPTIELGEARLVNLAVTFGELHVFEVWGLTDRPALLIGMDLIGTLRQFAVDYRRKEVQLMSFQAQLPVLRRCGPNECQSRIPAEPGT